MNIEIIAAIIDGGLGVVGLVTIAFFSWKIIMKLFTELKELKEIDSAHRKESIKAMSELAANINRMQEQQRNICKADNYVGKRDN